jgi:predicted secreted protein
MIRLHDAVRVSLAGVALAAAAVASAGPTLSLDAQARASVANDEMVVTLAAERDGQLVGPLNDAVLKQLNAALADAKAVPGVRARLGSLWTQPLHGRDGKPTGWRVRGEIVLESDRIPALADLGGRLGERLQLAGVQFRLSHGRRKAEEQRLLREAAQAFRDRAAEAAEAFGFRTFEMKELSVRAAGQPGPRPLMAARAMAEAASAPLPAEGGESEVVVVVTGTVELQP